MIASCVPMMARSLHPLSVGLLDEREAEANIPLCAGLDRVRPEALRSSPRECRRPSKRFPGGADVDLYRLLLTPLRTLLINVPAMRSLHLHPVCSATADVLAICL